LDFKFFENQLVRTTLTTGVNIFMKTGMAENWWDFFFQESETRYQNHF
jgi:hypothetical protein